MLLILASESIKHQRVKKTQSTFFHTKLPDCKRNCSQHANSPQSFIIHSSWMFYIFMLLCQRAIHSWGRVSVGTELGNTYSRFRRLLMSSSTLEDRFLTHHGPAPNICVAIFNAYLPGVIVANFSAQLPSATYMGRYKRLDPAQWAK